MSDESYDLGRAEVFDAEAIGQPGNRRFRLFARSRRGEASLWLERMQLEELSLAMDKLLSQVTGGDVLRPEAITSLATPPGAPADFPAHPAIEFQVAAMQLGFDEDRDTFFLRAAPLVLIEQDGQLSVDEEVETQFAATFTRLQATRLSAHLVSILAGGRPRCPFCGQPMQGQHFCEKQNGFHPAGLN